MEVFIISSGILAVALILNLIGSVLKYRTETPNELLAVVLMVISFILWCLIGAWKVLSILGAFSWYSIIVENGIFLGLLTSAMVITGEIFSTVSISFGNSERTLTKEKH